MPRHPSILLLCLLQTYQVCAWHDNTPLNVAWVPVRQWSQLLLERGITHSSPDVDAPPVLFITRLEESNPGPDLWQSYRLSRMFGQDDEITVAWLLATCLSYIWDQRVAGKMARLDTCRAELLAKLMLLRDTKWRHYSLHNSALLLEEEINLHFL